MTYFVEELLKQETESIFPSFSIVYETENLSSVELENIYRSLASLATQDISPAQANEFLIVDGGYAPAEVIEELSSKYPWINVKQVPGISYHEAKMKGATLATGEIVVFCDSDCVYEPNWLRNMLTLFQNREINIVAGETSTVIRNPYELAVAMNYLFSRFSNREHPYKSDHYFLNGVAFRRNFLLQNPIPCDLPLYRGHCKVHTYSLCYLQGHAIWKHPKAKAIHEPPTMSFISWRYLLMGHDNLVGNRVKRLLGKNQNNTFLADVNQTPAKKFRAFVSKILAPFKPKQALEVLREDPRRILMLPIAIPIVLWFRLLFSLGRLITYFQSDWLLQRYYQAENKLSESASRAGSQLSLNK
jgi:glycosyltransferase involved in cell wall biosynthesis